MIDAGQKWTKVWETSGNNADGIVGTPDGGLLIAQNDNAQVLKLDRDGKTSVAYKDTNTGGALSFSPKGALFIVQRGIGTAVWQLAPERKMLANRINGDPLECLGGVINDITADSKGGAYFTMGGLFYADAQGHRDALRREPAHQRRAAEPRREDASSSPTARRWRRSTCSPTAR